MPKKSLCFTPGPIAVVVGDPIETTGCAHDDLPEIMQHIWQAIIDYV